MQELLINLVYIATHEIMIFVFVMILSLCLLYKKRPRVALEILSVSFLVASVGSLLKIIWALPRPLDSLVSIGGFGFPSLHAAWVISFGAIIYLLFVRHLQSMKKRLLLDLLLILFVVVIGASRVLLGVHSVQDVIGGYAFGLIVAILIFVIGRKG